MLHFISHNYRNINGQIYLMLYIWVGEGEDGKYVYNNIKWSDSIKYNIKTVEYL